MAPVSMVMAAWMLLAAICAAGFYGLHTCRRMLRAESASGLRLAAVTSISTTAGFSSLSSHQRAVVFAASSGFETTHGPLMRSGPSTGSRIVKPSIECWPLRHLALVFVVVALLPFAARADFASQDYGSTYPVVHGAELSDVCTNLQAEVWGRDQYDWQMTFTAIATSVPTYQCDGHGRFDPFNSDSYTVLNCAVDACAAERLSDSSNGYCAPSDAVCIASLPEGSVLSSPSGGGGDASKDYQLQTIHLAAVTALFFALVVGYRQGRSGA